MYEEPKLDLHAYAINVDLLFLVFRLFVYDISELDFV